MDQLLAQKFILPVNEDEIFICLNPGYETKNSRFSAYQNTNISGEVIDWEKFKNQNIVKPIAPIEVKIEIPSTQESYVIPELKPVKKKAFFG